MTTEGPTRVTHLARGDTLEPADDASFVLVGADGQEIAFVASLPDLTRIIANLATLAGALRTTLAERKTGSVSLVRADTVATVSVDHDALGSGGILLSLTTPEGVTYNFGLSRPGAQEIARRLQTRSGHEQPPVGRA